MARIDFWHTQFPCIGTRKLAEKLCQEGYHIGHKLVRSLMREMGIHTVYPKANLSKRSFEVYRGIFGTTNAADLDSAALAC